jgi:hypothetical protein
MSSGSNLRLYPKRSITSHRFCGSGRLFRFKGETQQAESCMAELVVADQRSIPDAGKDMLPFSRCQGNIAKTAKKEQQIAKLSACKVEKSEDIAERARFSRQSAKRVYSGLNGSALPPAARSMLPSTSCLNGTVLRDDLRNAGLSSFLNSTEGCPDAVTRLAKKRSAGSGQQRCCHTNRCGRSALLRDSPISEDAIRT